VPPALAHICRRGLIDRTLIGADALREALQRWLEGRAPVVCPRTAIQRVLCGFSRFLDRNRILGPAMTLLVLAVLLASLGFTALRLLS
jgi:hypothetical protein